MFFTPFEIIDMVLMTVIIGYLFKDAFRQVPLRSSDSGDILAQYRVSRLHPKHIASKEFWWACAVIAPAIILHEMAHKFLALGFGLSATFHAACSTSDLALGGAFFSFACNLQILAVVLKSMGFGFLIFIPGYVSISAGATHLQSALIAFMGPAVHLTLWLAIAGLFRFNPKRFRKASSRTKIFLHFARQINLLLFIFNMIPIPGFDGFWVFYHLVKIFL